MPNTYNLPADATLAPRTDGSTVKFVVTAAQELDVYEDLEGMGADFMADGSVPMTGALQTTDIIPAITALGLLLNWSEGVPAIEIRSAGDTLFYDKSGEVTLIGRGSNLWEFRIPLKVLEPVASYDAATKAYVDTTIAAIPPGGTGDFMADGSVPLTGSITFDNATANLAIKGANGNLIQFTSIGNMTFGNGFGGTWLNFSKDAAIIAISAGHMITMATVPTAGDHVTNKAYVDNTIAALPPAGDFMASGSVPMTGDFVGGNNNIIDVNGVHLRSLFDINGVQRFNINDANFSLVFYKADGLATAFEYNGNADIFEFDIPVLLQGNVISAVADPVDPQDAATKAYVDDTIAALPPAGDFMANGSIPMTGPLGTAKIESLAEHVSLNTGSLIKVNDTDVTFSVAGLQLLDIRPFDILFRVGINANSFNIANLLDPVAAQDAATKAYVDLGDTVLLAKVATLESALAKAMALITALQAQVDAL